MGTPSATGPDVFARATRRLVLVFTAMVVLLVVVSGVIMYLNFRADIRDVAQGGSAGGGETEVERELATRSINRLRWQVIAVDGVIIVAVGALGLWYASRTLRPIRETYAAQKRFLADASHELRTPLAIMKADFEVALRDSGGPPGAEGPSAPRADGQQTSAPPPDELREALESGLEEVDRMSSIVDDVLLLSRIDAHQEELRFARVDLTELVRDTVESMRAMAEGGAVTLAVAAPAGAPPPPPAAGPRHRQRGRAPLRARVAQRPQERDRALRRRRHRRSDAERSGRRG
jgi:signal transduction histidine kinase